ncbi:MAG: CRTAC1 family protein [Chitinophagaceae bacterium]|nr:CRTAC1 family protein [Chitinophagaceae bacterium]
MNRFQYLLFLFFCYCNTEQESLFHRAKDTGIGFANTLTETDTFNIIDYLYFYNGGGVAIGDINNDGLSDIYFSANQLPNKLYLNKGNMQFEDITHTAGVSSEGMWKTGVTMADVNGDGLLDIYQCRLGDYQRITGKNELFINNGDLTFTEKAEEWEISFQGFSTQAAFFDMDNDGDLDMYLLNHAVHGKDRYIPAASIRPARSMVSGDVLYKNEGDFFIDITEEAKIYSSPIGYGLGIATADLNNDGWTDIYVGNDFQENDYLYINNKNGTFTESLTEYISHTSRFSMGNDIADFNNDGLLDIMSLDMLPPDEKTIKSSQGEDSYQIFNAKMGYGYAKQYARNTLQWNRGNGYFSEIAQLSGIQATDWSWSALLVDFDNDGWKDIFVSNGIMKRPNDMDYINFAMNEAIAYDENITDAEHINKMPNGIVPNYFFKNNTDMTFTDVSQKWGVTNPTISTATAYADLDNDGDIDIVINNINEKATILENTTNTKEHTKNNFITIILNGDKKNTFAIGAKITLYAQQKTIYNEIYHTRGFQSCSDTKLTIGLGETTNVDSIVIQWKKNKAETIKNIPVNKTIQIIEAEADIIPPQKNTDIPFLENISSALIGTFQHSENYFNDYDTEYLLPYTIAQEGPKIAVADINDDQLLDFYITGASGQNGTFFINNTHTFSQKKGFPITQNPLIEETDATFFKSKDTKKQYLYITAGGYEHQTPHPLVEDALFEKKNNTFLPHKTTPPISQQNSVVAPGDFDNDGDTDLFIGGRAITGKYGNIPQSFLLENDGNENFTDVTETKTEGLKYIGMVKDAIWENIKGDSTPELIICGEWMPITLFEYQTKLQKAKNTDLEMTNGWWNTMQTADIDNDGDTDIIAGNMGINSKLKPSKEFPTLLYVHDFDANNFLDQVIAYSTPNGIFPYNNRDELVRQMPFLKKNFLKYKDFAGKTIDKIFAPDKLNSAQKHQVYEAKSLFIENKGNGTFLTHPLPNEAQISSINAIEIYDVNGDGFLDIIAAGNKYNTQPYFGDLDASYGIILLGNGKRSFTPISLSQSGFFVKGMVQDMALIKNPKNTFLIIARNNDSPILFKFSAK